MPPEATDFDPTKPHALYSTFQPSWELCRDFAEMHEHILRAGAYLDQFGKGTKTMEAAGQYQWRKQASFAMDYCADLIDLRIGNLFRTEPERQYDESPYKEFIDEFLADVDTGGTSMNEFMADALRRHYALGVDIVVDKAAPPGDVDVSKLNKAQESDLGLRPYLSMFTPLERLDWGCNHAGQYTFVRYDLGDEAPSDERAQTQVRFYATYMPNQWRLYRVEGVGEKRTRTVETGTNAIGRIPVVQFYFGKSMRADYRGVPLSLLTRPAPVARALLNLVSQGQLDIYMAIGVLVAIGVEPDKLPTELMPMCWVGFSDPGAKVDQLRPAVEHVREKREWVRLLLETILRMGKLIGATGEVKGRATSGFQVQAERTDLDNEMAATAQQMEQVEAEVVQLAVSRKEGHLIAPDKIGYSVHYNRKYVLTPLNDILDQAKKAFDLDVADSTPDLLRPFLRRALDAIMKPSDPRYDEIAGQIEEADLSLVSSGAGATPPGVMTGGEDRREEEAE